MNYDLEDLFPEDISDETAFYLTEFMEQLSLIISDRYFVAARRHMRDCRPSPSDTPELVICSHKNEDDYSF